MHTDPIADMLTRVRNAGAAGHKRVDIPVSRVKVEIARLLHVDRAWVYENAQRLGAIELSDGPRSRLRFDPRRVADALAPRPHQPSPQPTSRPQPRRGTTEIDLLPIKGDR